MRIEFWNTTFKTKDYILFLYIFIQNIWYMYMYFAI